MVVAIESRKRLENTYFSMSKSLTKLKEAISTGRDNEIYYELGNTLQWMMIAEEWIWKNDKTFYQKTNNHLDGKLLRGLRHAYNLVKHDYMCIQSHTAKVIPKFTFPLIIPEEGIELGEILFVWAKNEEFQGDSKRQRDTYHNLLVDVNIIETIEQVKPYLEYEIKKYIE
ncbi:hypothetical protein NXZ75_10960 [Lysinibacillus sphaericus]|uniref:hypothetical protein n=1 Tax=Lysinibacillus sphaericus TaxID=1421 RepID=UPI002162BD91|nr:hypothetical protein [Lysinibacillus sphaericus]MCS1382712.1 hypothetical protein [Lysinibacillus sphaericus]